MIVQSGEKMQMLGVLHSWRVFVLVFVLVLMPLWTHQALSQEFAMTYPTNGATVSANPISLEGKGAQTGATIVVSVLTDKWYLQDGQSTIAADGSWTYGPCYVSGQKNFNSHTIKATLVKGGRILGIAQVRDVVRK